MAKVFLYDEFNPEDNAMLQALYSRSAKSVEEHVNKVQASGSGKFMETFYVGYGHMSIADCGSTTLFIENISTLADKAIQDWPLYSGQETSTRYVNMKTQPIVDPIGNTESMKIMINWMDFYSKSENGLTEHLKATYPLKADEDEKVYNKAIAARGFDIRRAFLPAGITTQLSWHTNLRQAYDKLALLKYWPLPEAQEIAEKMLGKLQTSYKHSFSHKLYEEQEAYRKQIMTTGAYYYPNEEIKGFSYKTNISKQELYKYHTEISTRPQKTNLPLFLGELGSFVFDFILDFGSFREIQRHRNGTCRMPLLTTEFGFNTWYLEQLPSDIRIEAEKLIESQKMLINNLDIAPELKQYYISLGFNMPCRVSYNLPASIYVTELRSGKMVHPTLRKIAHKMHTAIKTEFPDVKMHSDLDQSDWDVRRGYQDITRKKEEE